MVQLLYALSTVLLGGAVRTMMLGAGIGLVSSAFILDLVNRYLSKAAMPISGDGSSMFALMALSGLDKALSIVLGALVARVTINSLRLSLSKT